MVMVEEVEPVSEMRSGLISTERHPQHGTTSGGHGYVQLFCKRPKYDMSRRHECRLPMDLITRRHMDHKQG